MRIPLDRDGDEPLFRQIENWLRDGIVSGGLPPAMRLPSSRALASDLGVSRITVANAYAELDRDGLIVSREGSGTFVAAPVSVPSPAPASDGQSWPLWQQESRRSAAAVTPPRRASAPRTDRVHRCRRSANVPRQRVRQDHQGGSRSRRHERTGVWPVRPRVRPAARDRGATARQPGNPHQRPPGADHIRFATGDRVDLSGAAQTQATPCSSNNPRTTSPWTCSGRWASPSSAYRSTNTACVVELVEDLLQQHHPRLIYTIPNFQNPTGASLSGARRRRLLTLAARYNIPILEDDFVGDLRYEGRALPGDQSARPRRPGHLRRYLLQAVDAGLAGRVPRRRRTDSRTTRRPQAGPRPDDVAAHATRRRSLRHRRPLPSAPPSNDPRLPGPSRRMHAAVHEFLPGATVAPSHGGLFAWLRLPGAVSTQTLFPYALDEGVDFAPGHRFFANPTDGEHFLRLNFATRTPDEISQGTRRLGIALHRANNNGRR